MRSSRSLAHLSVADLTYVKSHTRVVYLAFIIDVFSPCVVGWQASTSRRSELALDALEMAIYARHNRELARLIHHNDRVVQGVFNRSLQHLNIGGANGQAIGLALKATTTTALAESFNGLYKTELIHRQGPCATSSTSNERH
ncbi:MAG: DDE-type integrase/transposase/recombinase [Acidimicrobiales bacterium]